jgi:histidyl-tRNA synthetase
MAINKVRGTRDLTHFSSYIKLFTHLRSHLLLHNFQEINTPTFEYEELFIKNLGVATDIVNKEMYYVDHIHNLDNEKKMVLRPEMTAPIMRAYLENNIQDSPWKVFQIGPTFRHERPQKGRYREFYQCSIELINAASVGYDIHLLSLLIEFFKDCIGMNFTLEINYIGSHEERTAFRNALYTYCFTHKEELPLSIQDKLQLETILRILDSKEEEVKKILQNAPSIKDFWSADNRKDWESITSHLTSLGVSFVHNKNLIRGLDYYNGLIFEFTSNDLGSQNTFCGGGRYDTLSKNFNNKTIPSLGAGIGIDRLLLIMEEIQKIKIEENTFIPILIETQDAINLPYSIQINHILTKNNIKSDIFFNKNSLKSGLKKVNSEKASHCIIITEQNIKDKTITLKDMNQEYHQEIIPLDLFDSKIKDKFLPRLLA